MEIQKPGFGIYDKQYVSVIRSDTPSSVKPNVLRNLEDPVVRAFILTDAVSLSPEAKKLLKKLANMERSGNFTLNDSQIFTEEQWVELYTALKQFAINNGNNNNNKKPDTIILNQRPFNPDIYGNSPEQYESAISDRQYKKRHSYQYSSPLEDLIAKIIVAAPSENTKKELIKELTVFGEEIIRSSKQFGIRIVVLRKGEHMGQLRIGGTTVVGRGEKTFDGRPWETVRGIYDQSRRLIVLGEELIGIPNAAPSRHEFAHAYDHMYTTKHGRKLPLSVQLWNLFNENRTNFISDYARTQPAEYFAESVEAFFNQTKHNKLAQCDPKMTQFLSTLFPRTII